jgi:protein TonB
MRAVELPPRDNGRLVVALVLSLLVHAALLWARVDALWPHVDASASRPFVVVVEPPAHPVSATVRLRPRPSPPPDDPRPAEAPAPATAAPEPARKAAVTRVVTRRAPAPASRLQAPADPSEPSGGESGPPGSGEGGESEGGLDGPGDGPEGAAAGSGGDGEGAGSGPAVAPGPQVRARYLASIRERVAAGRRVYPAAARRLGFEGTVEVSFEVLPDGRLGAVRASGSSGSELLDEAAVAFVASLAPFEPFPVGLPREPLSLRIPIDYRLR